MPETTDLTQAIAKLKAHSEHPETCQLHNETVACLQEVSRTTSRIETSLGRFVDDHTRAEGGNRHVQRWEFEQLDTAVREGFAAMRKTQDAQGTTLQSIQKTVTDHQTQHKLEEVGIKRRDKLQMTALQFISPLLLAALAWWLKAHGGG